jgi:hypothetical protein
MDEYVEAICKWYNAGMSEWQGPAVSRGNGEASRYLEDVVSWLLAEHPGVTGEMMKAGADCYLSIVEEV